jgi:hypothetical protein
LGCSYLFPKSKHWLLRNLTAQETVSSERLGDLVAQCSSASPLSLDEVLLMRTAWTSYPSYGDPTNGPMKYHKGAWAGHCFDIVPVGSLTSKNDTPRWTDVTEVVVKEAEILRKLFESPQDVDSDVYL